MKFAFASVVAIKNIKKEKKLTIDNIWVKKDLVQVILKLKNLSNF